MARSSTQIPYPLTYMSCLKSIVFKLDNNCDNNNNNNNDYDYDYDCNNDDDYNNDDDDNDDDRWLLTIQGI